MQACVQESLSDKQVQTIEDPLRCKSEKQKFYKYPCYYCDVTIAGENHLSEHRKKCKGTTKMCIVGLPLQGFFPGSPGFLPGFPPGFPPPGPYPCHGLTGFKF